MVVSSSQQSNLMALLGPGVAVYLAIFWPDIPVMQRTVGVFFVALVSPCGRRCATRAASRK